MTIANAYHSGCNGQTYRLLKAVKFGRLSIRLNLTFLPAAKLQCIRHCPPRNCLTVRRVAEPTGCYTSINNPTRHSHTAILLSLRQSRFSFSGKAATLLFSHGGKAARPAPSVGNHHHSFAELLLITTGHCKRLSIRLQWPDLPAARYGQGRTPIYPADLGLKPHAGRVTARGASRR